MTKLLPLLTLFALPALAEHGKVINYYVIAKQAAPFQIEDHNQHSGIVTDIVKAVFSNSDYQIEYHTYPFNRMISLLEAGGEPNWITYGSPEWGSVQADNLSAEPIYNVRHVLVSSHKKPFQFNTIEDIRNKVVVLLHGFDYPQLLPYINNGTVEELRVKDYGAAFRVIHKLPGDATFVEMESRVRYNMNIQHLDDDQYDIQPFGAVIPDYPIYLAFDPLMDPKLETFINQRLKELKTAGAINDIIQKYY